MGRQTRRRTLSKTKDKPTEVNQTSLADEATKKSEKRDIESRSSSSPSKTPPSKKKRTSDSSIPKSKLKVLEKPKASEGDEEIYPVPDENLKITEDESSENSGTNNNATISQVNDDPVRLLGNKRMSEVEGILNPTLKATHGTTPLMTFAVEETDDDVFTEEEDGPATFSAKKGAKGAPKSSGKKTKRTTTKTNNDAMMQQIMEELRLVKEQLRCKLLSCVRQALRWIPL